MRELAVGYFYGVMTCIILYIFVYLGNKFGLKLDNE